jgi:hypothetical protein
VIVNELPETVHGPDALKLTPSPELAVAESAIGETPYVTGDEGAVKLIDWDAMLIDKVVDAPAGLLFASPA